MAVNPTADAGASSASMMSPEWVYNYIVSHGVDEQTAAAAVGNFLVESGYGLKFRPEVISGRVRGDEGNSKYMVQWHRKYGRLDKYEAYCRARGIPEGSIKSQADFFLQEIGIGDPKLPGWDPKYQRAYAEIKAAPNLDEATLRFRKLYEQAWSKHDNLRKSNARKIAKIPLDPNIIANARMADASYAPRRRGQGAIPTPAAPPVVPGRTDRYETTPLGEMQAKGMLQSVAANNSLTPADLAVPANRVGTMPVRRVGPSYPNIPNPPTKAPMQGPPPGPPRPIVPPQVTARRIRNIYGAQQVDPMAEVKRQQQEVVNKQLLDIEREKMGQAIRSLKGFEEFKQRKLGRRKGPTSSILPSTSDGGVTTLPPVDPYSRPTTTVDVKPPVPGGRGWGKSGWSKHVFPASRNPQEYPQPEWQWDDNDVAVPAPTTPPPSPVGTYGNDVMNPPPESDDVFDYPHGAPAGTAGSGSGTGVPTPRPHPLGTSSGGIPVPGSKPSASTGTSGSSSSTDPVEAIIQKKLFGNRPDVIVRHGGGGNYYYEDRQRPGDLVVPLGKYDRERAEDIEVWFDAFGNTQSGAIPMMDSFDGTR